MNITKFRFNYIFKFIIHLKLQKKHLITSGYVDENYTHT
jgi:hypothetical protein